MDQRCTAVLVAAGSAQRMQGIDKTVAPLGGMPLVCRTVLALAASSAVSSIRIVTRRDLVKTVEELCAGLPKVEGVLEGGATRAESVLAGLRAVQTPYAAIHDGARPLVTVPVIDGAVSAARCSGAAAPAIPVHDTIKVAKAGLVEETPCRDTLFAVQTPQVFRTELLRAALEQAMAQGLPLTDDCSALEAAGHPVRLTPGSVENIKITTPLDLILAEAILKERECP